jgi:transcriptional regulator with XRE-family HTH domain
VADGIKATIRHEILKFVRALLRWLRSRHPNVMRIDVSGIVKPPKLKRSRLAFAADAIGIERIIEAVLKRPARNDLLVLRDAALVAAMSYTIASRPSEWIKTARRESPMPATLPPMGGRKLSKTSLAAARNTEELRQFLGGNLRKQRKRLGLSQEELAFRAQTHPSGIGPFELGKTIPIIDTMIRLAGALETTPGAFTAGVIWKPPQTFMTPGSFHVIDNPTLTAEASALREQAAKERLATERRAKERKRKAKK